MTEEVDDELLRAITTIENISVTNDRTIAICSYNVCNHLIKRLTYMEKGKQTLSMTIKTRGYPCNYIIGLIERMNRKEIYVDRRRQEAISIVYIEVSQKVRRQLMTVVISLKKLFFSKYNTVYN